MSAIRDNLGPGGPFRAWLIAQHPGEAWLEPLLDSLVAADGLGALAEVHYRHLTIGPNADGTSTVNVAFDELGSYTCSANVDSPGETLTAMVDARERMRKARG